MEHDRSSKDSIIYGQLTVAKVQTHEWTNRRIFFQQMLLEQLKFHMLKEKKNTYFIFYIIINLKWSTDLNVKPKTIK